MKYLAIGLVLVLLAAAPAGAEEYYWGEIQEGGNVWVDGYGDWGEVGYDGPDYYVHVDGFGDWIWITQEGDIWIDDRFWGTMNQYGDVVRDTTGFLFTIEYDPERDEFFHDGVVAYDPQTVFFVLAFEEKFFGRDVGLDDVFTFNQPPVAGIVWRTEGAITNVAFTADVFDLDGEIDDVLWDFGDGTTSTLFDPVHDYGRGGRFLVSLTAWDDGGKSVTVSRSIRLHSRPPKARFKRKRVRSVPGEMRFIDVSKDRNGTVVGWHWDFGDGTTSNERNPVHVYAERGRYVVTLTVTDDDGETGRRIKGVKIRFKKGI